MIFHTNITDPAIFHILKTSIYRITRHLYERIGNIFDSESLPTLLANMHLCLDRTFDIVHLA